MTTCEACLHPEWSLEEAARWGIPPHGCWAFEVDMGCDCLACWPVDETDAFCERWPR